MAVPFGHQPSPFSSGCAGLLPGLRTWSANISRARVIVQAVGMDLMTPEDRRLRDYAEADLKMKEARKRKRRLEEGL